MRHMHVLLNIHEFLITGTKKKTFLLTPENFIVSFDFDGKRKRKKNKVSKWVYIVLVLLLLPRASKTKSCFFFKKISISLNFIKIFHP